MSGTDWATTTQSDGRCHGRATRRSAEMTEAPTVQMFTKPDCVFCQAAKRVLTGAGIGYQELDTASAARLADSAVYFSGRLTVPQVFAGGRLIDAPGDLERLAAAR